MASNNYMSSKEETPFEKKTDINVLKQRVKLEQRKDKRTNVLYTIAAISVLAVSGLIISL